MLTVSIHALLAECDLAPYLRARQESGFNPRTPCGVRLNAVANLFTESRFQSTHSLRSATGHRRCHYPVWRVSIHALLAECDPVLMRGLGKRACFNPRTPCGVRHGDVAGTIGLFGFNPRTPCGVRLPVCPLYLAKDGFQSTHSLRSATACPAAFRSASTVSIHALLAECDHPGD